MTGRWLGPGPSVQPHWSICQFCPTLALGTKGFGKGGECHGSGVIQAEYGVSCPRTWSTDDSLQPWIELMHLGTGEIGV